MPRSIAARGRAAVDRGTFARRRDLRQGRHRRLDRGSRLHDPRGAGAEAVERGSPQKPLDLVGREPWVGGQHQRCDPGDVGGREARPGDGLSCSGRRHTVRGGLRIGPHIDVERRVEVHVTAAVVGCRVPHHAVAADAAHADHAVVLAGRGPGLLPQGVLGVHVEVLVARRREEKHAGAAVGGRGPVERRKCAGGDRRHVCAGADVDDAGAVHPSPLDRRHCGHDVRRGRNQERADDRPAGARRTDAVVRYARRRTGNVRAVPRTGTATAARRSVGDLGHARRDHASAGRQVAASPAKREAAVEDRDRHSSVEPTEPVEKRPGVGHAVVGVRAGAGGVRGVQEAPAVGVRLVRGRGDPRTGRTFARRVVDEGVSAEHQVESHLQAPGRATGRRGEGTQARPTRDAHGGAGDAGRPSVRERPEARESRLDPYHPERTQSGAKPIGPHDLSVVAFQQAVQRMAAPAQHHQLTGDEVGLRAVLVDHFRHRRRALPSRRRAQPRIDQEHVRVRAAPSRRHPGEYAGAAHERAVPRGVAAAPLRGVELLPRGLAGTGRLGLGSGRDRRQRQSRQRDGGADDDGAHTEPHGSSFGRVHSQSHTRQGPSPYGRCTARAAMSPKGRISRAGAKRSGRCPSGRSPGCPVSEAGPSGASHCSLGLDRQRARSCEFVADECGGGAGGSPPLASSLGLAARSDRSEVGRRRNEKADGPGRMP